MIRWLFFGCLLCLAFGRDATVLAKNSPQEPAIWQITTDHHSQATLDHALPASGQAESDLGSPAAKPSSGSWKKGLSPFTALVRQSERQHFGKFNQYEDFATNLPVRLRKADLFFPYHYFW